MPTAAFQSRFDAWLDSELAQPVPESVIAFNFNLAEPWCIEIVGSDSYSDEDSDWACDESFRSANEPLELIDVDVGRTWAAVLEGAKILVSAYLSKPSTGSAILRKAEAVTVGFVDGDLERVWPK
ncbi:hypothetical protein [Polaromonas sp. YR568]|uniref:hypothetical protein n=1 Tax=Polaromonas sp. YR568 TaxID=1855301 RepID=UPI00398BDB8E